MFKDFIDKNVTYILNSTVMKITIIYDLHKRQFQYRTE